MPSGRMRIGYPNPGTYSLAADSGSISLSGQTASLTYSGSSSFTFNTGWTPVSGSFGSANTLSFAKTDNDLGTGPNVAFFADFRDGTDGSTISKSQLVGAYTTLTDSDHPNTDGPTGTQPKYKLGPDGQVWMNTLTPALASTDDYSVANIQWAEHFDCFYVSNRQYYDGSGTLGSSNQKDIWFTYYDGVSNDTGVTHDQYLSAYNGLFANSGGNFFFDDSSDDHASNPPLNSGAFRRLTENFHSCGIRPNTGAGTAAQNVMADVFHHNCNPTDGRKQSTSTGHETAWPNSYSPFGWNYVYMTGVYQDQQEPDHVAGPPYATYYLWNDILIQTGDNCWKRFFFTNASTLAASTAIYDCLITNWTGGGSALSIRVPRGMPNYNSGWYLWYGDWTTYTQVGHS